VLVKTRGSTRGEVQADKFKRISLQAYKLALLASMRHIHDTFHISLLDPNY